LIAQLLLPLFVVNASLQSSLDSVVLRDKLANGLEVIVVQNSAVSLATALVAVHSGAFTQDSNEAGIAHLYEHMLFRSFRHTPSAFGMETTRLKGTYNGSTSAEVVNYYVQVPSENIEPAIALLADLMQQARFSNGELKSERAIVLNELQRSESDPEGNLQRQVSRALWGSAWHRKDVAGDSSSLQGISVERLQATFARYYIPNNAALIVTGDVVPERIFTVAEHEFGKWQAGPNPFADRPIPPMPRIANTTAVLVPEDVLDATIEVQLYGPSVAADPGSTYAADVLFDVFNDAGSSFQRRLVADGPFESIAGSYQTLNHTGPIVFHGIATPQNAKAAILALLDELQNLDLLDGVTDDDLAIARKRRQVRGALARERTAGLAPDIATWWSTAGIDYYLTYSTHAATQTADSLRRFARTYVVGAPRVVGVLGTGPLVAQIGEWLRQGARPPSGAPAAAKP
jgi:zinc protease